MRAPPDGFSRQARGEATAFRRWWPVTLSAHQINMMLLRGARALGAHGWPFARLPPKTIRILRFGHPLDELESLGARALGDDDENEMIRVQRSADRYYVRAGAMKMWKTFGPAPLEAPSHRGFRTLESLDEVSLPSETGFNLLLDQEHEALTYVREGGLLVRNRPRGIELLGPGSYQRASSPPWMISQAPKMSSSSKTQLFMSLIRARPDEVEPSYEHSQFHFADRHGRLQRVASPDGQAGSLRLRQDVYLYSSLLDIGHHVVHELRAGRGAWLHVVAGRIRLIDQSLETGDAASFEGEAAVSFTAQAASEILLFDLA